MTDQICAACDDKATWLVKSSDQHQIPTTASLCKPHAQASHDSGPRKGQKHKDVSLEDRERWRLSREEFRALMPSNLQDAPHGKVLQHRLCDPSRSDWGAKRLVPDVELDKERALRQKKPEMGRGLTP